jgi:predicted dehydrogenase
MATEASGDGKQGRQVRVAVLGAANFSQVAHIPGVNAHPQGTVVALYSRDLARAREMAERNGVPEATDDLEALLARPDVDAVTVPSSNEQHHPYTMAALRAGKHVFCEKPMALNVAQAAEMAREARQRGLVGQMAFIFRYTDSITELRRRVSAGEIGTPHYVEISGEALSPQVVQAASPGGAAGPVSAGLGSWRTDPSRHHYGHLGEMGPHFLDTVNFVCGPTGGFITEVAAVTHTVPRTVSTPDRQERPFEPLDLASFLWRTERGVQGHVVVSRASAPPIAYGAVHGYDSPRGHMGYVIVNGTQGALMATFTRGEVESLRQLRPGGQWETVDLGPAAMDGQPHGINRMLGAFVDSILRGDTDPEHDASFEDGFRSQAAIDAIIAGSTSKRWEPVATNA